MKLAGTDPDKLPFSTLFLHYLTGNEKIADFFDYSPFDDEDITLCAGSVPEPENRETLVEALKTFNRDFGLHPNAIQNLERLAVPGSLTIVTGQQLTLYGGPLYTILKTLTAIRLSKHYEALLGRAVIPVFWLADEDHDYEEAATISIPAPSGHYSTMLKDSNGHRGSVGRIELGDDISRISRELSEIMPDTDFSADLWELLNACYKPENTFREAMANYLSSLFSRHGLIFAGSDDPVIKRLMVEPLARAISDAGPLQQALEDTSGQIEKAYHRQANVLDNTLFLHTKSGNRERLSRSNGDWHTESGEKISSEKLLHLASVSPEVFSPNVFLRPVLQDYMLPNLGYVAGPGEIAYYAQMKSFYHAFDRKMPLIIPRLSATIIEPAIERIMSGLPFELQHYQERIEDLEKKWLQLSEAPDADLLFERWNNDVDALNRRYEEEVKNIEPTLTDTASKTTAEYKKSLEKLKQKLNRAIKSKQETQLKRIARIKNELLPNGGLQERNIAHIYFMNKYGIGIWDELLLAMTPEAIRSHQLVYIHRSVL
ncbi:MAG: bacillithiol biosynthesis cysteine-adding enzyme BshC [Rhodothermaceae bacterium]|nr:bacillithiol biosynthesis cysteine-adding enzyme BshC [Rhodothermaceae bacterium]